MDASSPERDLLIALFATPTLDRGAVSLLAREPARWAGRSLGAPPGQDGGSAPGSIARLAAELGLPADPLRRAVLAAASAAGLAARERERAASHGGRLLTWLDPDYPEPLRHLALPPPVLSVRSAPGAGGDLASILGEPAVAVVGSREAGEYGLEAAEGFARGFAAAGVTVISGFARGIDAAAHRGALAGGGRTVAVLGCGLGIDYPRGHARLGEEIAARGALLSEFPCGTAPRGWHFPVRNRLIAALAAGTLVVEATARSGSLVTARHALDIGREVWAVPGRIVDPRAAGPNALIRDGAALVEHPRDVLESLGLGGRVASPAAAPGEPATAARAPATAVTPVGMERPPGLAGTLLDGLPVAGGAMPPEEIAAAAAVSVDRALAGLLELELGGFVVRRPGPRFARAG